MMQQFRPRISKPIDFVELLRLCEKEAVERVNDLAMLSILHAWLKRSKTALEFCARAQSAPQPAPGANRASDAQIEAFCASLAHEIETGSPEGFLLTDFSGTA